MTQNKDIIRLAQEQRDKFFKFIGEIIEKKGSN